MDVSVAQAQESFLAWLPKAIEQQFGATVWEDLPVMAAVFIGTLLALLVLKYVLLDHVKKVAERTPTKFDDLLVDLLRNIGLPFFLAVCLFVSVQHMMLPNVVDVVIRGLFLVALVYEAVDVGQQIIIYFLMARMRQRGEETLHASAAIRVMVKIILWSVGILLVLSNLGFNVNSLIASLGIAGLAVSLALQNVLSDFFASFSIIIDKPFEEGDFIIVGTDMGTVKHIGLKTTRVQTLRGEELVISNAELTSTRVQNFKKLNERRIAFAVGVVYDTPVEKLKAIPGIVQEIVDREEMARFDRAHLKEMAAYSLDFEIVYYVLDKEYVTYMNVHHSINMQILEAFEREGISIAFPSQSLYVEKTTPLAANVA